MPCTFTIIVPTHKRPILLSRTLQSLAAQSYAFFNVIVVDDAAAYVPPYHDLAALQGKYTFVIRSGLGGPALSRNMAMRLVESDYVMFLDDDDTIAPTHLQAIADHLKLRRPPLLFCDFSVQYEDRTSTPPRLLSREVVSLDQVTRDSIFVLNRIPNSCMLYRHDILSGKWHDTTLDIYEDWDFLLSCLEEHALEHVPTHSVTIHKSQANAPENMRRGNSRHDLTAQVMLELYKKHRAPNEATRLARQELLTRAGVPFSPDQC